MCLFTFVHHLFAFAPVCSLCSLCLLLWVLTYEATKSPSEQWNLNNVATRQPVHRWPGLLPSELPVNELCNSEEEMWASANSRASHDGVYDNLHMEAYNSTRVFHLGRARGIREWHIFFAWR